jgi:hypothetical protein
VARFSCRDERGGVGREQEAALYRVGRRVVYRLHIAGVVLVALFERQSTLRMQFANLVAGHAANNLCSAHAFRRERAAV